MSQEAIVQLGGDRFGLLSGGDASVQGGTCLLLLNAGFIHRSGPFRLHVRLARRLAQAGIKVVQDLCLMVEHRALM